jgi:glycosyltransferase involved in cell wall biosynthesis
LKLLFLCKQFPLATGYGEMRYVAGLCAALAGQGLEVHVLAEDAGPLYRTVQEGDLTVHPMGRPWPFHHYDDDADALLKANQLLGEGLKLCSRIGQVDLMCFQGWETALPGLALSERLGVPSVYLLHHGALDGGTQPADDAARYRAEMEAWACERADMIVCSGHPVAIALSGRHGVNGSKVTIVAPACDPALIDPGDTNLDDFRALFARPEDLAVLFAGKLTSDNGPDALLQALPQVLDRSPALRAIFGGEGPLAGELMQAAERLGVAEHCLFMGGVGQCVLSALYHTCDVLVCPPSYAPSGVGVVEALSAGLPVVASDTGALAHLVRDGRNGLLVPPSDPDGLAGALVWLARHRDRLQAMSAQALAAGQGWTWEMAAGRFIDGVRCVRRPEVMSESARVE